MPGDLSDEDRRKLTAPPALGGAAVGGASPVDGRTGQVSGHLIADQPIDVIPKYIGPYRILEIIGEGGMGIVYKAQQRHPIRRDVAVKVIKQGMDTKEVIARFNSERQAMARMDHPNIATVYEAGADTDGKPYFAMEYVPGEPIIQFCDRLQLPVKKRLELFVGVCDAITHAHAKGIIHRDIKPNNVLGYTVGDKPIAKVIDFGIAKALTGESLSDLTYNTAGGEVIGTWEYMSPEQAGAEKDVDTRTDVYSLGVLLYELLSGIKPFDLRKIVDEEARRIIREKQAPKPSTRLSNLNNDSQAIANSRQTRVEQLERDLRQELEWIPLMAIRKERQRRYQTPQQLADDVRNYLNGAALLAGPESRLYRLKKSISQNRGPVLAVATVMLVLVGGIVATLLMAQRATRAQSQARQEREVADSARLEAVNQRTSAEKATTRAVLGEQNTRAALDEAQQQNYFAAIGMATVAFEQMHLTRARSWLDSAPAGLRKWEWGYLQSALDQSICTIKNQSAGIAKSAQFSRDGTKILRASDYEIELMDIVAGRRFLYGWKPELINGLYHRLPDALLSPDGSVIVIQYRSGRAVLQNSTSVAEFTEIRKSWKRPTSAPATGPNGVKDSPYLAPPFACFTTDSSKFLIADADGSATILDSRSAKAVSRLNGNLSMIVCAEFSNDGRRVVTGSYDSTARVWDVESGRMVAVVQAHTARVTTVHFDAEGLKVLTVGYDYIACISEANTGRLLASSRDKNVRVDSAMFNPAGDEIISWSYGQGTHIWDATFSREITKLPSNFGISYCQDASRLMTIGEGGIIRIWSAKSYEELAELHGHASGIRAAAFTLDGNRIITCGAGGEIKVWDVTHISAHEEARRTPGCCLGLVNPAGTKCLLGYRDVNGKTSTEWVMDIRSGHRTLIRRVPYPVADNREPFIRYSPVAFSPDGTLVAEVVDRLDDNQFTAEIWDCTSGKLHAELRGHTARLTWICFSNDGKKVITVSEDETARIWDVESGRTIAVLPGHGTGIRSAQFDTNGTRVITCADTTSRIWDATTGQQKLLLQPPDSDAFISSAFSPDGKYILTVPGAGAPQILDSQSGLKLATLGSEPCRTAAFNRDGSLIVTTESNNAVIWKAGTWKQIASFPSVGQSLISSVDINPDNTRLVTASIEKSIRLWDVASGRDLLSLTGPADPIELVRFSQDGSRILGTTVNDVYEWDSISNAQRSEAEHTVVLPELSRP